MNQAGEGKVFGREDLGQEISNTSPSLLALSDLNWEIQTASLTYIYCTCVLSGLVYMFK